MEESARSSWMLFNDYLLDCRLSANAHRVDEQSTNEHHLRTERKSLCDVGRFPDARVEHDSNFFAYSALDDGVESVERTDSSVDLSCCMVRHTNAIDTGSRSGSFRVGDWEKKRKKTSEASAWAYPGRGARAWKLPGLTTLDPFENERLASAELFPLLDDPRKLLPALGFAMPARVPGVRLALFQRREEEKIRKSELTKLDRSKTDLLPCSRARSLVLYTSLGRLVRLSRARSRFLGRRHSLLMRYHRACEKE